MEKKAIIEKNPLLDNCISEILEGKENLIEILKRYDDVSLTQVLNYCSNDATLTKKVTEKASEFILDSKPGLDEYLTLFQDERKEPLDAVLLGINEMQKQYRKTPDAPIMEQLENDVRLMRKYKEPYKEGNRYGTIDPNTDEIKYPSKTEIAATLNFLNDSHKDAIQTLGFVPDYLVSQHVRSYLSRNNETRESQTLGDIKVPKPTNARAVTIAKIQEKMATKANRTHEINDLDKYIDFMEGQNKDRQGEEK